MVRKMCRVVVVIIISVFKVLFLRSQLKKITIKI